MVEFFILQASYCEVFINMFKMLIVINLLLILISLGAGVVFLAKDNGSNKRVVTSLTFRIVLSFTLFILLIIGYYTGQITPHQL